MVKGDNEVAPDPEFPEQFRSYSENEKHWQARRRGGSTPLRLDQLLSLSMVWANHLFLGCSYSKDLLEKVTEMADGIEVEDVPHFTTRDELIKR
uniref:CDKN2A interacting protein N-terminal like n=1 Tax=Naja naja TaxID=35670 RepID=A0A8C6X6S5_NAJNA